MALLGIQHRKPVGSNKALAPSHERGHVQAGASGPYGIGRRTRSFPTVAVAGCVVVGDVDDRDGGTLWIASLLAGISAEDAAERAGSAATTGSVGVVGDLAVRQGLGRGVPGPVGGEAAR